MEALGLLITLGVVGMILASIGRGKSYRNHFTSQKSRDHSRQSSRRAMVKKGSKTKRYRINQYGEVFEE